MDSNDESVQIPAKVFHEVRSVMKFVLDLEEMKYASGRNDPQFRFFKKQLMKATYDMLRRVFEWMASLKLIEKTDYPEDVKGGFKPDTPSQGSGYVHTTELEEWLAQRS